MQAQADTKLVPTVRAECITADGVAVLIEASGPGVSASKARQARRNHRLWNAGYRPDRTGHWRKP